MGHSNQIVLACGGGIDQIGLVLMLVVIGGVLYSFVVLWQWMFAETAEERLSSCAERNICYQCKYDLRGITALVCPECGTKVPKELLRCLETGEDLDATPGIPAVRPPSSA